MIASEVTGPSMPRYTGESWGTKPVLESTAPKRMTSSEAPTLEKVRERRSSQKASAVTPATSAAMVSGS